MEITIKADWAKRYMGSPEKRVQAQDGVAAREAVLLAGIPEDEIGVLTMNGVKIADETPLNDGAQVQVYTVIIGG